MNIRPIKTEDDYKWALAEAARYFEKEPKKGSDDGDRFEILLELISAYEEKTISFGGVDPIDALKAFMENAGRSQSELAVLFGSRSRASEVLNRKRALTLDMVHKLHKEWNAPVELLIAPYALVA